MSHKRHRHRKAHGAFRHLAPARNTSEGNGSSQSQPSQSQPSQENENENENGD